MPIDYSAIAAAGGLGKGPSRDAAKQTRAELLVKLDKAESAKAKARAAGICEIVIDGRACVRDDKHTHHMLPGHGTRGKGFSALAECKQRACPKCHDLITRKKVQRIGVAMPHYRDTYRSVK